MKKIASFIKEKLGPGVPWHISRFYPMYLLPEIIQTPLDTLHRARKIGLDMGLSYVYEGNVPSEGEDTLCPKCGETLVKRIGYEIIENCLKGSHCSICDFRVDGVWE